MPPRKNPRQKELTADEIEAIIPENCALSDLDCGSSDEEDISIHSDSDDDPEYTPPVPRGMQTVTSESDQSADELVVGPQNSTPPVKKTKTKKNNEPKHKWVKCDISCTVLDEPTFTVVDDVRTPYEYFTEFFSDETLEMIVEQTNLYSVQVDQTSVNLTINELRDFLAILIIMGIIQLPSYVDYWQTNMKIPLVSEVMSLRRFKKIRRYIHFNDNTKLGESNDRFFKVRPLLTAIRDRCRQVEQENCFSIDETMIPYKGTRAGNLRQYIKNKPHKWGFKFFERAGPSGMIYDFIDYQGKLTFEFHGPNNDEEKQFGVGGQTVLVLCKTIPDDKDVIVYFDNFFSSIKLMSYLKAEHNMLSLGTLRANRLEECPLTSDKELKNQGRGKFDYRKNDDGVIVVKWMDNKCVTIASTSTGVEPLGTVPRYDKTEKKKVSVTCPSIIKQYNCNMGGVDLSNMFISLYRTPSKARRWYFPIFAYMIDLSVVNGWLLYRRHCAQLKVKYTSLKNFRSDVAEALRGKDRPRKGRPSIEKLGEMQEPSSQTTCGRCTL